jgi:L-ascorbate 6-phosphate lactonase
MKQILDYHLSASEAALWWLGQAGYIVRSPDCTVIIDPYLTDSAAKEAPELSRRYPAPVDPATLHGDIYIVTHNHLDHLDPDTISSYKNRDTTWFVAPRQAAKKLASLGIPEERMVCLHAGETWQSHAVTITGVFALPTGADVLDTTGYLIQFDNGRSFYHTSDTAFHQLVLAAAPKKPEVMLVPINGKWGNPGPEQAALFARAVQPEYVLPNHYDLMELNAENPETFRWFCTQYGMGAQCKIPSLMQPFVWSNGENFHKPNSDTKKCNYGIDSDFFE